MDPSGASDPPPAPAQGIIRYLLDGQVREVVGADPTRTVLQHLREDLRRTGTKEGCAEGDYGACTVVVGELHPGGGVGWRAVCACIQFLPMIDGKALVTVESLAKERLHPAQQAMVDHHGSQCGFCTPGVVMSLYGRAIGATGADGPIDEVLAGNLCRCTGYGPIIAGAEATPPDAPPDVEAALVALRREATLDVAFEDRLSGQSRRWLSPRSVEVLAEAVIAEPQAVLVAGATDVGLWVTKQHRALATIIYLGEVAGLSTISEDAQGVQFGAAVRYGDALPALTSIHPDLGAMVRRLGGMQVRASGTIGGNIANGSPIGDMPPALIALGATLVLRRGEARRRLPLEDYFLAYGRQDRRPGEFVEAVIVPRPAPGSIYKLFKISKRFDQDISALCAAFALKVEDGVVTAARIAFGGMAATPRRASACEAALVGRPWAVDAVVDAQAALDADFQPISDLRASAAYRALVARNLLLKVLIETTAPGIATRVLDLAHG